MKKPVIRAISVLPRFLVTISLIIAVCLTLTFPVSASSDDGLQIHINKFVLQVRFGIEFELFALYKKEKLYIDFFHVLSLIKQNYEHVKHLNKDIYISVERKEGGSELVFSWFPEKGENEVTSRDHMTLCNILKDKLDLTFDNTIKEIAIGYTTYNDYEDIEEGATETEIYIGAIPGSYEVFLDDELVEVFAWCRELEAKKYYKDGRVYREDRTLNMTADNFDKYLAGYLAFND